MRTSELNSPLLRRVHPLPRGHSGYNGRHALEQPPARPSFCCTHPLPFRRCFNTDGEGMSAKMTGSPTATFERRGESLRPRHVREVDTLAGVCRKPRRLWAISCPWNRNARQSEAIRAIMLDDSPCCGGPVPHLSQPSCERALSRLKTDARRSFTPIAFSDL